METCVVMQRRARAALVLALALAVARADRSLLPLKCPPPPANCKIVEEGAGNEYYFDVSGNHISFEFVDGAFFKLTCEYSLTLEDRNLPRFEDVRLVQQVQFDKCAPPMNKSYVTVLTEFNVTMYSELLLHSVPTSVVRREHFAGLQQLTKFALWGTAGADARLEPGALSALAAMPRLQHLMLHTVRTPAEDLAYLPPSLNWLKLWYLGVDQIYFNKLPKLTTLDVAENHVIAFNVSNCTALKVLAVSAPSTVVSDDVLPKTLTQLTLSGWNETRPLPMMSCAHLEHLKVYGTRELTWSVSFPNEWVARCGRLTSLAMYNVPVNGTLPARLLAQAYELRILTIKYCNLTSLPLGFLNETKLLTSLDLSYNRLSVLPSGLFMDTPSLQSLDLSYNRLRSEAARSLSTVTSLRTLRLNDNAQLGDMCSAGSSSIRVPADESQLKWLKSLTHLYLHRTSVSFVCRDWRQSLRNLMELDLRYTKITDLNFMELQFWREKTGAKVLLAGREFKFQSLDRHDYVTDWTGHKASVTVKGKLVCDCNAYWPSQEFKRSSSLAMNIDLPKCKILNKILAKVDVDRLTCNAKEKCNLLENCTCEERGDVQHGHVVTATCAGLTRLPRLPAAEHKWRLHLAHNHISNITALTQANIAHVVEIDLRNNSIKRMDGQTARTLACVSLRLGGNELECECDSYGMVSALRDPGSGLRDKVNVTCKGGVPLGKVPVTPCEDTQNVTVEVVAAVGVLLMVAAAAYTMLASSAVHRLVKRFLVRVGWRRARVEPSDEDRRFDVFVSYAHQDEELVVERLAARLESGARPYRLCLHYRDWAPGEWIPAQIAASVRASRRTLAVVSRHYLESGWARAEFREASAATLRDGTPRLVLVLLEEPAGLPLDAELHAYVLNNTYVRWGDPWFWTKLEEALPPPRPRTKARSPPAPCADIPLEDKCTVPESTPSPPVPPTLRHTPCSA